MPRKFSEVCLKFGFLTAKLQLLFFFLFLEGVERQETGSKSSPEAGKRPTASLPIGLSVQWGERSGYL